MSSAPTRATSYDWPSPAFSRPVFPRTSLAGTLFDPLPDREEDGFVPGLGRKRPRFARPSGEWTFVNEPASPIRSVDIWEDKNEDEESSRSENLLDEELQEALEDNSVASFKRSRELSPGADGDRPFKAAIPYENQDQTLDSSIQRVTGTNVGAESGRASGTAPKHSDRTVDLSDENALHKVSLTPRLRPLLSPGMPVVSPLKISAFNGGYFQMQPSSLSKQDPMNVTVSGDDQSWRGTSVLQQSLFGHGTYAVHERTLESSNSQKIRTEDTLTPNDWIQGTEYQTVISKPSLSAIGENMVNKDQKQDTFPEEESYISANCIARSPDRTQGVENITNNRANIEFQGSEVPFKYGPGGITKSTEMIENKFEQMIEAMDDDSSLTSGEGAFFDMERLAETEKPDGDQNAIESPGKPGDAVCCYKHEVETELASEPERATGQEDSGVSGMKNVEAESGWISNDMKYYLKKGLEAPPLDSKSYSDGSEYSMREESETENQESMHQGRCPSEHETTVLSTSDEDNETAQSEATDWDKYAIAVEDTNQSEDGREQEYMNKPKDVNEVEVGDQRGEPIKVEKTSPSLLPEQRLPESPEPRHTHRPARLSGRAHVLDTAQSKNISDAAISDDPSPVSPNHTVPSTTTSATATHSASSSGSVSATASVTNTNANADIDAGATDMSYGIFRRAAAASRRRRREQAQEKEWERQAQLKIRRRTRSEWEEENNQERMLSVRRSTRLSQRLSQGMDSSQSEDYSHDGREKPQTPEQSQDRDRDQSRCQNPNETHSHRQRRTSRSRGHRRVTIHELRRGRQYTEVGVPADRKAIHQLRDGTKYTDYRP